MQSTLIAFKGDHEAARSVGDTNQDSIEALLEKSHLSARDVPEPVLSFSRGGLVPMLSPCVLPLVPIVLLARRYRSTGWGRLQPSQRDWPCLLLQSSACSSPSSASRNWTR